MRWPEIARKTNEAKSISKPTSDTIETGITGEGRTSEYHDAHQYTNLVIGKNRYDKTNIKQTLKKIKNELISICNELCEINDSQHGTIAISVYTKEINQETKQPSSKLKETSISISEDEIISSQLKQVRLEEKDAKVLKNHDVIILFSSSIGYDLSLESIVDNEHFERKLKDALRKLDFFKYIDSIRYQSVGRIEQKFSTKFYSKLIFECLKNYDTEIHANLEKIKLNLKNKIEKLEKGEKFLLDLNHLTRFIYRLQSLPTAEIESKVKEFLAKNRNKNINILINWFKSTINFLIENKAREIQDKLLLNGLNYENEKIKMVLHLYFHNPLCAEKNIDDVEIRKVKNLTQILEVALRKREQPVLKDSNEKEEFIEIDETKNSFLYHNIERCISCRLINNIRKLNGQKIDWPFPLKRKSCIKVNPERKKIKLNRNEKENGDNLSDGPKSPEPKLANKTPHTPSPYIQRNVNQECGSAIKARPI